MRSRTEASRQAVRRGHVRTTTATLHTLAGKVADLPVSDGSLTMSMSASPGVRSGRITVPGYEWWPLFSPHTACWVEVSQTIEGETWNLGQWPVASVEENYPGGEVNVELEDWAARRDRSVAEWQQSMGYGTTVAQMFQNYTSHLMPGGVFTVTRDDTNGAARPYVPQVQTGASVWDAMTECANTAGAVLVVESRTEGHVRVFNPYEPYHDEITGTVVRATVKLDLADVYNRVVVEMRGADEAVFTGRRTITAGDWAFSRDGAGFCILTDSQSNETATQAMADAEAKRIYERRAGAVRTVDVEVIPQPWIEIGDILVWQVDSDRLELFSVETVEYPLRADQSMRLTSREVPNA